jgi:hypothetical protein
MALAGRHDPSAAGTVQPDVQKRAVASVGLGRRIKRPEPQPDDE